MTLTRIEIDVPTPVAELAVPVGRTALLVVDMQNESCHPDGKNYIAGQAESAVEATNELVARVRDHGGPVVWLQSVRRPDQPIFQHFGVPPYRLEGTWSTEIVEPLEPAAGEPVIKKYSHDCFFDTELEAYLARHSISGPQWTFIVAGVAFVGCVYIAVTGLSVRDFSVVVPMDCVSPRTGDRAAMTMARLAHRSYAFNVTLLAASTGLHFSAA